MDVKILYGTETGNSESLAQDAKNGLAAAGMSAEVLDMANVSINDLKNYENLIIITSTWGDGEPPSNAQDLYDSLEGNADVSLSNLKYAVFSIGESFYDKFCQTGIDFDEFLSNHNAKRILPVEKSDGDFNDRFPQWLENFKNTVQANQA